MYKPESKYRDTDLRMPVMMCGYRMQLRMSSHSMRRTRERTQDSVQDMFYRIGLLLENPSVSEYITLEVKIGEDCVIFDGNSGCSYVLVVEETEIVVKTIYKPKTSTDTKRVGRDDFCMFVQEEEVLCAGISRDVRLDVNNLTMGLHRPAMA